MPHIFETPHGGGRRGFGVNLQAGKLDRPQSTTNGNRPQDFRSLGDVAAEVVADLAFERRIERLHRLGPRATAELLRELGAERGIQSLIEAKLVRYGELNPGVVASLGADRMPPRVVHGVAR